MPPRLLRLSAPILCTTLLFGCTKASETDPRLQPPLVRVAAVQKAQASERAFTGVVAARVLSELGFRINGKITQRLVDVGQRVKRGQVLMRLDPVDLQLVLTSRLGDEASAQAR